MPRQNRVPMVRDRVWGIWGELKLRRQIENERFGCPSQVLYFARSSVGAILPHKLFAGTPQSTDVGF